MDEEKIIQYLKVLGANKKEIGTILGLGRTTIWKKVNKVEDTLDESEKNLILTIFELSNKLAIARLTSCSGEIQYGVSSQG